MAETYNVQIDESICATYRTRYLWSLDGSPIGGWSGHIGELRRMDDCCGVWLLRNLDVHARLTAGQLEAIATFICKLEKETRKLARTRSRNGSD